MKTLRLSLCAVCFLITPALQAHLPGEYISRPKSTLFVKVTAPVPYFKPFHAEQALPLARYYAGVKQKSTVLSKPLKLSFQLGKYLLLNLSYN